MRFQVQVHVSLRPSVLDPAGAAVEASLHQLGHEQVQQVRIGRFIEFSLGAESEAQARIQADQICQQLLANPVIEIYTIQVASLPHSPEPQSLEMHPR
ncbi:MAG: phosphoribosylformylglycinamidine synthase subunit PurS [Synechococcaceae cyanobacterium SM2_3_1]|nr:phosphoribosylformylglycinamidine synthase subunit PurS [Synechococcaceae cyanobacterium SM2_3_1]